MNIKYKRIFLLFIVFVSFLAIIKVVEPLTICCGCCLIMTGDTTCCGVADACCEVQGGGTYITCRSNADCPDNNNICDGTEYCNTTTGQCAKTGVLTCGTGYCDTALGCVSPPASLCEITTVTAVAGTGCIGNYCGAGDKIRITFNLSGCSDNFDKFVLFYVNGSNPNNQGGTCLVNYTGELSGMYYPIGSTTPLGTASYRTFDYTIPSVHKDCNNVQLSTLKGYIIYGEAVPAFDSSILAVYPESYNTAFSSNVILTQCSDGVTNTTVGEQCDDGNLNNGDCCSSTCQYESSSTVCRPFSGTCDVAEYCTGSSASCPVNAYGTARKGLCPTCYGCTGTSATCQLIGANLDPWNSCTGNCDECNGAGACRGDQALNCTSGNCGTCTQYTTTNFSCAINNATCTGNCDYCTGSGYTFNCAAIPGSCLGTDGSCNCSGSGTAFNCMNCTLLNASCSAGSCIQWQDSCINDFDCGACDYCFANATRGGFKDCFFKAVNSECGDGSCDQCNGAGTCVAMTGVNDTIGLQTCKSTCQICSAGSCILQTAAQDILNQCNPSGWNGCSADSCDRTMSNTGFCSGSSAACGTNSTTIAASKVCSFGVEVDAASTALACDRNTNFYASANQCIYYARYSECSAGGVCDTLASTNYGQSTSMYPAANYVTTASSGGASVPTTAVTSTAYCSGPINICTDGACAGFEYYRGCTGTSAFCKTDNTGAFAVNVFATVGYTLTASCGLTGITNCSYSPYNQCFGIIPARDPYRCDVSHACAYDVGTAYGTACSGSTPYCSAGTCVVCTIGTQATDCNDGKLCTQDLCSAGVCTHPAAPSSTVCRAAITSPFPNCDVPEYCTGSSASCPVDAYSTTDLCGTCQNCTGLSATCSLVSSGADPNNDCANSYSCSLETIRNNGVCNGLGACGINVATCSGNCDSKCAAGNSTCYNTAANADPLNLCSGTFSCVGESIINYGMCSSGPGCGFNVTVCSGNCDSKCAGANSTCYNTAANADPLNLCSAGYTCSGQTIINGAMCSAFTTCGGVGATCTGGENSRCITGSGTCQNLCSNGIDDDGNGYIDGNDTNCGGCGQCNTGNCCNLATGCYLSSSTVCRASAGVCDIADKCTGSSASCPSDARNASTDVCRSAPLPCDIAETCNGGVACPADVVRSLSTTIDYGCGICQYCNGVSAACANIPANTDYPISGCSGNCDVCNGAGSCVANASANICSGNCDVCSFVSATSYSCAANNALCVGTCDVCSGVGNSFNCTASSGLCSGTCAVCSNIAANNYSCTAGSCSGTDASCQCLGGGTTFSCTTCTNPQYCSLNACVGCTVANQATDCNDFNVCNQDLCSAGVCSHPAAASSTVCRPADASGCDIAETCGGATTCPAADIKRPLNTNCGGFCQACNAVGQCVNTLNADPWNECTASYTTCSNCQLSGPDGMCDGAGACDIAGNNSYVSPGYVCTGVGANTALLTCANKCNAGLSVCTLPNITSVPLGCNGAGVCSFVGSPTCILTPFGCAQCTANSNCTAIPNPICANATVRTTYSGVCNASYNCTYPGVNTACSGSTPWCGNVSSIGTCVQCTTNTQCNDNNPCTADTCNALGQCTNSTPATAGTSCRASLGVCDLPDSCTGTSLYCPDNKNSTSNICRVAVGDCDVAENCDGTNNNCPTDTFRPSSYNPPGVCLNCTGNSAYPVIVAAGSDYHNECTTGALESPTVCQSNSCTGTSASCAYLTSSTTCRATAGLCDIAETCSGSSYACPSNSFRPFNYDIPSSVCLNCTGSSAVPIPASLGSDPFNECATAAYGLPGSCESPNCNGLGACGFLSSGSMCRPPQSNTCDVAETCSGSSFDCGVDVYGVGNLCGTCYNLCTGSQLACTVASAGTDPTNECLGNCDACAGGVAACVPSNVTCTGNCDVCSGSGVNYNCQASSGCSGSCGSCTRATATNFSCAVNSTLCVGNCDVCSPVSATVFNCGAGSCSGINASCECFPFAVNNYSCTVCSGSQFCTAGSCVGCTVANQAVDCFDGKLCTQDLCSAGVCSHPAAASSTVCRPAVVGGCDVAETCGGATTCPVDVVVPLYSDCPGVCTSCDATGNCAATPNTQDFVNDCVGGFTVCSSACQRSGPNGLCSGFIGSCSATLNTSYIASGYVCTGTGLETPLSCVNNCSSSPSSCSFPNITRTPYACNGAGSCTAPGVANSCMVTPLGCANCTADPQCTSLPAATCANATVRTTYYGDCVNYNCTYLGTNTACIAPTPWCGNVSSIGTCVDCLNNNSQCTNVPVPICYNTTARTVYSGLCTGYDCTYPGAASSCSGNTAYCSMIAGVGTCVNCDLTSQCTAVPNATCYNITVRTTYTGLCTAGKTCSYPGTNITCLAGESCSIQAGNAVCTAHCGNTILEPQFGEECDDGNIVSGDGCDAQCKLTTCSVCSASINASVGCIGSVCSMTDLLRAGFGLSGNNCDKAQNIQIDYYTNDAKCVIQRSGINMSGINDNFSVAASQSCSVVFPFNYTIPSIPDACAGKNLTNITVGIYSDSFTVLRSNTYYFGNTNMITLDQCSQYGTVASYRTSSIQAIYTGGPGGCIGNTCHDYDAVPVIVNTTTFGVHIYNKTSDSFNFYQCGITDNVCPDDFTYLGGCGSTGICNINGVPDNDCVPQTDMKCGSTFNTSNVFVPSCNVPTVPPGVPVHFGCALNNSCVYANEFTGANPACHNIGVIINNAQGYPIQCMSVNNIWCPQGFTYNLLLGSCQPPQNQCNQIGCPEAVYVVSILDGRYNNVKDMNTYDKYNYYNYLNNSNCFAIDPNTSRRYAYCGVTIPIPGLQLYEMRDVSIIYSFNITSSGTDACVDNDHDSYYAISAQCLTGTDCNDTISSVNPGMQESLTTAYDDNCDGSLYT